MEFWKYIPKEYCPQVKKFTNTSEFQTTGQFFRDNKCYTLYPKGTIQYNEFWHEERKRCLEGYTNSVGIKITGQHYYYLNFVRIEREDGKKRKILDFPKFVDIDYCYFHVVNYAKENEESVVTSKGRRGGYSYKAGGICSHEFNFFVDSSCLIGAYLSNYSDTTMRMVIQNCNFLNEHTEFRRQRNPDTPEFIHARYQAEVEGVKIWRGLNSKVASLTFKDRPGAAVGRSATWLILDEAGLFPNIVETYGLTEPTIKDGSTFTGCCLMYGSSDTMGFGSINLKKIFTDPEQFNMLAFPNPKNPDKKIGFFSPSFMGRWGVCKNKNSKYYMQPMVDEDGNSIIEAALDDIIGMREKARKGNDPKAYKDIISQFPIDWEEAFRVVTDSPFPTYLAEETLADLETKPNLNTGRSLKLINNNSIISFEDNNDHKAITNFPLSSNDDKTGSVEIWEHPYQDNPVFGVYLAGIDPYDDDDAMSSNSLGSMFIMHKITGKIVAEYTGRPQTAKEFYENCMRLALYYNASILYENNKKGIFTYFEQRNMIYLLADTPKILRDTQIIKTIYGSGNQSKGYPATKESVKYGIELIKTYLLEPYIQPEDDSEAPKSLTYTHTIKSKPLLKEILYWHPDLNVDRLRALAALLILREDRYKQTPSLEEEDTQTDKLSFFNTFFKNRPKLPDSYKRLGSNLG